MSTVLAYAYGKCIAVICLTLILALSMFPLMLLDRSALPTIIISINMVMIYHVILSLEYLVFIHGVDQPK